MLPLALISTALRLATFNVGCGFARKLPDIIHRSLSLSLDIIALQEVGEPHIESLTHLHPHHFLVVAPGPSNHTAGVALLISNALAPRCREYKRTKCGRLIGVVIDLTRGCRLLIVCAYMPSGIDDASSASSDIASAHALYSDISQWSVGMQQVIVMGDLNETLTPYDRLPLRHRPHASSASPPIHSLQQSGFIDEYRRHHPDAALSPGYTHIYPSAIRPSSSRFDYIWTLGLPAASSRRIAIDQKLCTLSHHHLLWMELVLPQIVMNDTPLVRMRLPNLRAAITRHERLFVSDLNRHVINRSHLLDSLLHSPDVATLSDAASLLTSLTRDAAYIHLPTTGATPLRTRSALQLQKQRRDLTRLLRISIALNHAGHAMTSCLEWRRLYRCCMYHHRVQWHTDIRFSCDTHAWIDETRQHIRSARSAFVVECQRVHHRPKAHFDANPAAAVHRMLSGDALPSRLFSVVDSAGELTSSFAELENVMVQHFTSVFAIPPPAVLPYVAPPSYPVDPPTMLYQKRGLLPQWYDGLMVDVLPAELMSTISDAPRISAPGLDGVSVGVWKIALQGSAALQHQVASLFSACLRTSIFPSAWKDSIIIPFVKDAQKERAMSNIRPISLQSCLGKLLNKILAHRLAAIIARHPILNPSQRGFITGGTTIKCIDELLDAWDWSRTKKCEQYTLFYDIRQAYDSVQSFAMLRALRRIRLPSSFIDLIGDSLTDLTSCVRTEYGLTRSFPVKRSLRQGDPLAPLLFVILMDALHDGLDVHPVTLEQHGFTFRSGNDSVYLALLGYADDTATITHSLTSLHTQNEWIQYFMHFNAMRLNALKCELVGRKADGSAVTVSDIAAADICIDGVALIPRSHDAAIRYLGVHSSFDGDWGTQQQKSRALILLFTRLVSKSKLSVSQAKYMFTTFMLPKLELALHYVHGAGTSEWIRQCDFLMIASIRHAISSPLLLSHSAVASVVGLCLPSWAEVSVKVSELFLRMNSTDVRWGPLGRMHMRLQCGSSHGSNYPSRLARAEYLATTRLQWSLTLHQAQRSRSRRLLDSHVNAQDDMPSPEQCSSTPQIRLIDVPGRVNIVHDHWLGWGSAISSQLVHAYTDGSYVSTPSSSSWAVVIADQWFDDNHPTIPIDELLIRSADLAGSVMFGACIECTHGVYPAELQAIVRVLAMLPSSFHVHVHSDSRSSLEAIYEYEHQVNERRRMRMSARPLLRLISHLICTRQRAGGAVTFSHVKAHIDGTDMHSIGNRMADYQAELARKRSEHSYPLTLRELPLDQCEQHLTVADTDAQHVIDDIRRAAALAMRAAGVSKWSSKSDIGYFAGAGMIELGRVALLCGSYAQQSTMVHVATNTSHFHLFTDAHRVTSVQQLQCDDCSESYTVEHLT